MHNSRRILTYSIETQLVRPTFSNDQILPIDHHDNVLRVAREENPDLILLGFGNDFSSLRICEALRSSEGTCSIPVFFFSDRDQSEIRIAVFQAGADDFLSRTFSSQEIQLRVEARLRRTRARPQAAHILNCGNLLINRQKYEASINGKALALSVLEFRLLGYFVNNLDRVVSRDEILKGVWNGVPVAARTVDTHVASLRKRLAGCNHELSTVYGAGYILKKQAQSVLSEVSEQLSGIRA